jgi:RNA polymerase sigma-70 factor (ECF subfamily)
MGMSAVVGKVLSGDREAFSLIVREYGIGVRAFLAAHVSDPGMIDDLAQETFIAAYRSLGTCRDENDIGAWIKGIARNKLRMHFRENYSEKRRMEFVRAKTIEDLSEDLANATGDDTSKTVERLRDCMKRLPERLRLVIAARYYGRERVSALAERLGSSVTAVSSLLYRGRAELRMCIEKEG